VRPKIINTNRIENSHFGSRTLTLIHAQPKNFLKVIEPPPLLVKMIISSFIQSTHHSMNEVKSVTRSNAFTTSPLQINATLRGNLHIRN
jgi:hypothetical protein